MNTFWTTGYERTSMPELLEAMRINRGSFYDTYGSKRDILLQALEYYGETVMRKAFADARRRNEPDQTILAFFDWLLRQSIGAGAKRGCFFVNCALELAPSDPQVARRVRRATREMEEFFRLCLVEGRSAGSVSRDLDPGETARSLVALAMGMRVLARSGAKRSSLESVTRQVGFMIAS